MSDKRLDPDRLVSSLPNLSSVQAFGRAGVFRKCPFSLSWQGEFAATVHSGIDLHKLDREDIVLDSPIGEITLERPLITRVDFHRGIKGLAKCIHLRRRLVDGASQVKRVFIQADPDLWSRVTFPKNLILTSVSGVARALLPLNVRAGILEVFFLKEGPFVVLEFRPSSGATSDWHSLREVVNAARHLLTYLTGERLDGASCEVLADEQTDEVIEATWHQGRDPLRHSIYHPIPVCWKEHDDAHRLLKLESAPGGPLAPRVLSKCLDYYLSNPALVTVLEYLIRFPDAPLEMRGALLSVALESLTDHLEKAGVLAALKLLPEATWLELRDRLLGLVEAELSTCSEDQKSAFRNRVSNLNRPTNNQKLKQPFEVLGLNLTAEQVTAIRHRNKLLHQGRLFDPEVVEADPTAWREAYAIEMELYTAINKLLLKRMGYVGPIIDWGKTSVDSGAEAYQLI